MHLQGAKALVTGAAQGLGKSFMEALLSRGASVCFCDIQEQKGKDTEQEFQEKFGQDKVVFIHCDVRSQDMLNNMFKEAVSKMGHLDLVVNNAGIVNESKFQDTIDTNLVAVLLGSQLAIDHMRRDQGGKGGVIINISSISALQPFYAVPVYSATKHGVKGFTESWASNPHMKEELGIQIACLCPNITNTPLLDYGTDGCLYYDETRHLVTGDNCMDVEDVCNAFLQLVESDDCNGDVLSVSKREGIIYYKKNNKFV